MYFFSYLLSINVTLAAPQYLPDVIVETNESLTKECPLLENQCILENFTNVTEDMIPLEYPQRYLGGILFWLHFQTKKMHHTG